MTWLITDAEFTLVIDGESSWLAGYTHRHEWLGYGEGTTDDERQRISSLSLNWEVRKKGSGHVRHYLELEGGVAPESAATAVRMPSDVIVVIAEVSEPRWAAFLRAFEVFSAATYPKHFRINVPFESLSTRNQRSLALEQFLAGSLTNSSPEEVSAVFFFGSDLPEARP